jgi:hypothetical protein
METKHEKPKKETLNPKEKVYWTSSDYENERRNTTIEQYDAWMLEKLEDMKLPIFTVKTSETLNMRIDQLIQEIKEQR